MEEQNSWTLLDSINGVISPEFTKLSGLEFNYDENWVNYTLFYDYLGVEVSSNSSVLSLVSDANVKLKIRKKNFLVLKDELEEKWNDELWAAYNYYLENFRKIELFFDLLELYIPIEALKIKMFQGEKLDNLEEHILKIEELEAIIFGEKLSDRPKEAKMTLEYLNKIYSEKQNNLSSAEKRFLDVIISEIEEKISASWNAWTKQVDGSNMDLKDPLMGIEWLDASILEKEISRDEYVKIFQLAIDVLGLEGLEVQLKDNISNISVSYNSINIPAVHQDYETLKVGRIIGLISHELERHAVWNVNNKTFIWNLKSLSYLGQEEWVAHIMEHLALWYDLNHMPINRYMPRMLVWEQVNGERFKEFLHIMNKLDDQNIDVEKFFKRFKRWKDFSLPGVNPKEKLYGIWAFEVINRIRAWENPLGFFLAKNGTWEQEQITEMIAWEVWEITPKILHDKHAVLPLMLWELLRYKVLNPVESDKWMLWGFLKHFNDRYGKLFDGFGIDYKEFIRNHIGVQNKQNREKVKEILQILES